MPERLRASEPTIDLAGLASRLGRVCWALFLLALPVTSFPYFPPAFGGEALVRPLSLYPLLILLPIVILGSFFRRRLPISFQPLGLFILVATASTLAAGLAAPEPLQGVSSELRLLRGVITLLIGASFYLVISLWPVSLDDLRSSLRWIYAGCGVAMGWGSLQTIYLLTSNQAWFNLLARLQAFISIRPLQPDRVSGMTYEPHWFAEQLILLLLPWTLAALLTGQSAWRWGKIPVEALLFGWLIVLLPFTYSRSGTLNLVSVCILGVMFWGIQGGFRKALHRAPAGKPSTISAAERSILSPRDALIRRRWSILLPASILLLVLSSLWVIGSRSAFFARMWRYWANASTREAAQASGVTDYLSYLGLDARLMYSQAAYRAYQQQPFLGIGLGNYAFHVEALLPERPLAAVPEVLKVITPDQGRVRLVTPKNFYARLLAETGILGTIAFMSFLATVFMRAVALWSSPLLADKYWGMAGLLGLAAFLFSAMSFDSFVFPNMWVVFGLITAASLSSTSERGQARLAVRVP